MSEYFLSISAVGLLISACPSDTAVSEKQQGSQMLAQEQAEEGRLPRAGGPQASNFEAHAEADGEDVANPSKDSASTEQSDAQDTFVTDADPAIDTEVFADSENTEQEVIEPPEDYGLLKFPISAPSEEELVVHGLAGYSVVTIYAEPDTNSNKLGYLRFGTRVKVGEKIEGEGCSSGFYALPQGGFVCASKGFLVDSKRPPFMKNEPVKAKISEAFPYEYGYVHKWNSPMWWRIPTKEELTLAEKIRAEKEALRLAEEAKLKEKKQQATSTVAVKGTKPTDASKVTNAKTGTSQAVNTQTEINFLPSLADSTENTNEVVHATQATPVESTKSQDPDQPSEITDEQSPSLPLNPQTPWMEKGFFVSIDSKVVEDGKTYYRTARGAYVLAADVSVYTPKDFQGVALTDEVLFPVAFVNRKDTSLMELNEEDKLKTVKKLVQRDFIDVDEETEVNGKVYMLTPDGLLVRKDHLVLPDLQPMPEGLDPWEHWIDVSLSKQMLVAYEGTKPVYVTLISSGRKGTKEESFATPKGRWRIKSKHVSTTMDGNTASDGNYSIQDVPWTMFFSGSYGLHGAFWHRGFGRVRSHGCVNLGPTDARWLFNWTTPFLPEGWHGVNATEDSLGSTVVVRD